MDSIGLVVVLQKSERNAWSVKSYFLFSLGSHSKQARDECHLLHAVSFFHAMYLTFPEHIHGFISAASVRQAVSNEKKPIPSLTSRLMRAMILFDEVIEIRALPQFTRVWHEPFRFELASTPLDKPRFYQP
jgi:hypothetical protein